MPLCGLTTVRRAVETDLTKLRYASAITEQNKRNVRSYWLTSLTGLKFCASTPNNTQHHATGCATCNIQRKNNCWLTMLRQFIGGSRGGARAPPAPPFNLRSNWGPKDRKLIFEAGSPLSQGLDDRAPPLPEGLYPTLEFALGLTSIVDVHSRNLYFPKNKSRVKNVFLRPPTIQWRRVSFLRMTNFLLFNWPTVYVI